MGDLTVRTLRVPATGQALMSVIVIFAGLVVVGEFFAVLIAAGVEHISKTAGLLVFFALFAGVFVVSWILAVRIVEHHLIRSN
jgi:hypothetical protein